MRTGPFFRKELTMPLDTVQSTADAHTTGSRDGASHRAAGRLDVTLASPGTPGTGTNPAMLQTRTATRVLCPHRRMRTSTVVSSPPRRRVLASAAAAGAFGLVLLAAPSSAQTVAAAGTQAAVSSPLPANLGRDSRSFGANMCCSAYHVACSGNPLTRKTICFSRSIQMHDIVIGLFVNRYECGLLV